MIYDSFEFTYIGGRDENQDSLGKKESKTGGIYVVADGLGGHEKGGIASRCAVEVLTNSWNENEAPDKERLKQQIGLVNEEILRIQKEENCVTKTTVAVLSVVGDRAVWANTGDSRVYYIHDGGLAGFTADHSVAYMKYKTGEITRAEIAKDEDQSCLLRALGNASRWEPNTYGADSLCAGDAFLLCSDGFWEYVSDEEILVDYLKAASAKEWARLMLLRAIDRVEPGNDNLSLITVMLNDG